MVGILGSPGSERSKRRRHIEPLQAGRQLRVTLPESRLQHNGHRIRIEVITMRNGAASVGCSND